MNCPKAITSLWGLHYVVKLNDGYVEDNSDLVTPVRFGDKSFKNEPAKLYVIISKEAI